MEFCNDAYEALDGADGVVILTEWNEFRALDLARVKALLKRPLMVDLRNIYRPGANGGGGFHLYQRGPRNDCTGLGWVAPRKPAPLCKTANRWAASANWGLTAQACR